MKGRFLAALAAMAATIVLAAPAAHAHPLGNFTINQYSGLHLNRSSLGIDLVTDMAEIPTYQVRGDIDTNHDGRVDPGEAARWRTVQCRAQASRLTVTIDGRVTSLTTLDGATLSFPPGQGGLSTLRLECSITASFDGRRAHDIEYVDANFDGRLGWREITAAAGSGVDLVASSVPAASPSERLTRYPASLLRSPLSQRAASLRSQPASAGLPERPEPAAPVPAAVTGPASILPRGVDRPTRAFTALVARQHLGLVFGMVALVLAVALGAIHALAPGHGKTVMAAYLVGQRGSARHAAMIGLTVTATHTAGVLLLGLVLTTSAVVAPERLYPWLGAASGVLLAGIGISLLVRTRRAAHARHHHHDHDHDEEHSHGPHHHTHAPVTPDMGWRSLIAMGFAGGMVPSPSALVVLLGAIALRRAWFGLLLVVGYGAGMAATLTCAGMLLVRARALLDRRRAADGHGPRPRLVALARALPVASSMVIVGVGLFLAGRGLASV